MGLFGFGKKTSTNGTLSWLNKVDSAYNLAFQTKSVKPIETYVDRSLAVELIDKIRAGEKAYAGLDRYKHVEWFKLKTEGDTTTYVKDVHYDHVKFSHGIVAPVGDDHKEKWIVKTEPELCVMSIRRMAS